MVFSVMFRVTGLAARFGDGLCGHFSGPGFAVIFRAPGVFAVVVRVTGFAVIFGDVVCGPFWDPRSGPRFLSPVGSGSSFEPSSSRVCLARLLPS